jgi:ribonuclease HI
MASRYIANSDGACKKTKKGGCGTFLIKDNKEVVSAYSLDVDTTTNNQMELIGVILSITLFLQAIKGTRGNSLEIRTDSQYVVKGINEWIHGWIKKGWQTTTGPVANKEIWVTLKNFLDKHKHDNKITLKWVKGHNGEPGNETADHIAGDIKYEFGVDTAMQMLTEKINFWYKDESDPDVDDACLLNTDNYEMFLLGADIVDKELLAAVITV